MLIYHIKPQYNTCSMSNSDQIQVVGIPLQCTAFELLELFCFILCPCSLDDNVSTWPVSRSMNLIKYTLTCENSNAGKAAHGKRNCTLQQSVKGTEAHM